MASLVYPEGPITTIQSALYFLKPNKLFEVEKPYAFKFPVDAVNIHQTNMETELCKVITLTDIRGYEQSFTIETNGFAVLAFDSGIKYEDFHHEAGVSLYLSKIESFLKSYLGASQVDVFRHCIRKRDPQYPISTGEKYDYDQPTTVAHCDTTVKEAAVEVRRQRGEDADDLLKKRIQWINIWKPLKGPMNDWPLALCDASTVNKDLDLEPADLIYPDFATENAPTYHNPNQKWFYLSNHDVSEIIIFKQSDSLSSACSGVPHCSFANPLAPAGEEPRESIEARALVYYDE